MVVIIVAVAAYFIGWKFGDTIQEMIKSLKEKEVK
jgi:hypothetical protein